MSLAIRSDVGWGRYSPDSPGIPEQPGVPTVDSNGIPLRAGECDIVYGTVRTFHRDGSRPPLLYAHGSGDDALDVDQDLAQRALVRRLAETFTVLVADFGLQRWGDDEQVEKLEHGRLYLAEEWGTTGPVTIVAGSMGMLGACGYARQHREHLNAIAGIIPALDLWDLKANRGAGGGPDGIDQAYPPSGYDDAVHGPTHNPVLYADQLDPELPIAIWTATNDAICVPSTADAFCAARPETERFSLGAVAPTGHHDNAVVTATAGVLQWVRSAA